MGSGGKSFPSRPGLDRYCGEGKRLLCVGSGVSKVNWVIGEALWSKIFGAVASACDTSVFNHRVGQLAINIKYDRLQPL